MEEMISYNKTTNVWQLLDSFGSRFVMVKLIILERFYSLTTCKKYNSSKKIMGSMNIFFFSFNRYCLVKTKNIFTHYFTFSPVFLVRNNVSLPITFYFWQEKQGKGEIMGKNIVLFLIRHFLLKRKSSKKISMHPI